MSSLLYVHTYWTLAENAFHLSVARWERYEGKFSLSREDLNTIELMLSECEKCLKERHLSKGAWKTYNHLYRAIQIYLNDSIARSQV